MKKALILSAIVSLAFMRMSYSQTKISSPNDVPAFEEINTTKTPQDADKIYDAVEIAPEFPGGFPQFAQYIKDNLKPVDYKGKVFVRFVIEKDGTVTNVTVVGTHPPAAAEKEAIRVMAASPKWKAAKIHQQPVRSFYTSPVNFN